MKLHRMLGTGLPNIYLDGGVTFAGSGDAETIAYADVDGLYVAISRAISLSTSQMSKEELRFVRKRLGLTQGQVGAVGGKSGQVAAKWEKGQLPVPVAEANLLRLMWLGAKSRRDLARVFKRLGRADEAMPQSRYVFRFSGKRWEQDEEQSSASAVSESWEMTQATIKRVRAGEASPSQYEYTSGGANPIPRTFRTDASKAHT